MFPAGKTVREVLLEAMAKEPIEDHERETRAAITLTKVGFEDEDKVASTCPAAGASAAVARELVREPDLLLLDEPTNHLDLQGIVWLERLLREASFGYLVATHDRAFLRAVADEVIEINRVYPNGSFRSRGRTTTSSIAARSSWRARPAPSRPSPIRSAARRSGSAARPRPDAQGRLGIDAAMNRREELGDLKYRNAAAGTAAIDFVGTGRQTRKLLTVTGVAKSLGGRPLFSNLEMILSPGTKLGLLGPNGSGKSTFLKVLTGELPPDTGTVVPADNLKTVMFEQGRARLDLNVSLRRACAPTARRWSSATGRSTSSPGRRSSSSRRSSSKSPSPSSAAASRPASASPNCCQARRPAVARQADERPRHPALEVLEASLAEFSGALVIVSHDRELLDGLCTEVIGLDGKGGRRCTAAWTSG